jgi:Mrp family chromosome partitioning ATPase
MLWKLKQNTPNAPKAAPPSPADLRPALEEAVHYMEVRRCLDRIFAGDQAPRIVAVTSLGSGEGKTTFCLAAAWSLSERAGLKVLLLDATNFDRPTSVRMDDICGVQSEQPYLVQPVSGPGSVAYAWAPPTAVGTSTFRAQLDRVSQGYDVVLVDTVALDVSSRLETDPFEVARASDGLVLVRSEGRSDPSASGHWIRELQSRGVRILGVVANNTESEK